MNSTVNFIIESGVSLSLLAIIYVLFLRRETFFRANRLFLLGSVIFSVVLPFLKFRVFAPQPVMLSEVTVTPYRNLLEVVTIYGHDFSGSVERAVLSSEMLMFAYLAGVLFFFGRFVFRTLQVVFLIRKNPVRQMNGFKLVFLEKQTSPFSFLDYIFIHPAMKGKESYERMLAHELEHVKQGHSVDVIILEILTVFQWFNPFMWMLRRAIRENHEFLADRAVLVSGVNRGYYKKLLLEQVSGGQLVIANNFNYSLIKKRIKMMSKIKSSKLAFTKIALGVLVAAALVIAFACEQKETAVPEQAESVSSVKLTIQNEYMKIDGTAEDIARLKSIFSGETGFQIITDSEGNTLLVKKPVTKKISTDDEIFFIVEEMPEFPGGELELRKFIANQVKYPEEAQRNKIQGKVYVTFVVSKDGSVVDAKIARGVDPVLDQEALRVVGSLPKWKPGKQRGQAVNVQYTVPINFQLQ